MTEKSLSQKICEVCGVECVKSIKGCYNCNYSVFDEDNSFECKLKEFPIDCGLNSKFYPDFENNNNKLKLINLLIENDHIVTMSKDYCAVGNGAHDFIDDGYNEHFEIEGSNLLEALYNYLTRWIEQSTSFMKEDGTMSEYIDTSHTLERDDCYYSYGFDNYLKDIEKIKQAIKQADWVI